MQASLSVVAFQPGFYLPFPSNVQLLIPNEVVYCLCLPAVSDRPAPIPAPSCLFPPFCLLLSNQQNPAHRAPHLRHSV